MFWYKEWKFLEANINCPMIRQKFCVNKKLVERWKKSLNSRDIPEAAAAASTGCASLSRLSATMQQCSLCSCSICIAHCMSSFLCHKFACAFFVDYVPCTVVQTVTTSTWYTELCKVSNTTIFRTGLQSSEATASVSQCQSLDRQPFFPAPPSILTRRHAPLCSTYSRQHFHMEICQTSTCSRNTICSLHLFIRKYFWKSTILSKIRLPPLWRHAPPCSNYSRQHFHMEICQTCSRNTFGSNNLQPAPVSKKVFLKIHNFVKDIDKKPSSSMEEKTLPYALCVKECKRENWWQWWTYNSIERCWGMDDIGSKCDIFC